MLSVVILGTVCKIFGIDLKEKKAGADQPSSPTQGQQGQQQPSPNQDIPVSQELPVVSFYGEFFNTALLNGSISEAQLNLEAAGSFLRIWGYAYTVGLLYEQNLDITIPMPEGTMFTCFDEVNGVSLTITLHLEDHSLNVVQQPTDSDIGAPYTGLYVDRLTSVGMSELDGAMGRVYSAWDARGEFVTKSEPTPDGDYDYYHDMNTYILEGNGVTYRCDSTENGGSISITLARNDAYSALQYFYASIYAYDSNGELSRIIEGYLTTMIDNSLGIYSDSGYLSVTQGENCLYVVEYGTFISPDIVFSGTYYG